MTLQSRFHFLNLWDETDDEGEGGEGAMREQQSAGIGPSQWANGNTVSGKCVWFVSVCVCADLNCSFSCFPVSSLLFFFPFVVFLLSENFTDVHIDSLFFWSKHPAGGSKCSAKVLQWLK